MRARISRQCHSLLIGPEMRPRTPSPTWQVRNPSAPVRARGQPARSVRITGSFLLPATRPGPPRTRAQESASGFCKVGVQGACRGIPRWKQQNLLSVKSASAGRLTPWIKGHDKGTEFWLNYRLSGSALCGKESLKGRHLSGPTVRDPRHHGNPNGVGEEHPSPRCLAGRRRLMK